MANYDLLHQTRRVIIINLIIIVFFSIFAHYYQYHQTKAISVFLQEGIFQLTMEEKDLLNIKEMIIEQKKVTYQIEVDDEIMVDQSLKQYRKATFKTDLIKTKFVKVIIVYQPTTIKKEILKYIKEKSR